MNRLTFNELADMHLCFGATNSNALAARRLYAERFPQRYLPCHVSFSNLDRRLRETGNFRVSSVLKLFRERVKLFFTRHRHL